ncbi:MAG: GTPase HflX [Oscillospiraceae bacterium]|nr:GTPase HflX [Oscillospiraceae bacterium]
MNYFENNESQEKALLICVDTGDFDAEASLNELELLAESAGAKVEGKILQRRPSPDPATYIGRGRLAEAELFCHNTEIDLIICDGELSPSQIRNIEKATDVRVIDRTQLILDIFALRAKSREGKLQVEVAQLRYALPRLTGKGTELSRLGGGIGTRGPGESKLESDRRHIMRRIHALEEQLEAIEKRRSLIRKRREKNEVITAALVGYTNAGKSTLMNALTNAGVLAEDKLFATLDPTSRKLTLQNGQSIMLIDTVGFVSRLPHDLVKAFKSTLEEAAGADIVLNVCDASDPRCSEHIEITTNILKELGCVGDNIITVMNKCDMAENVYDILPFGKTVMISALKNVNLDLLLKEIEDRLAVKSTQLTLIIPFSDGSAVNDVRNSGKILSEEFTEKGTLLKVILPADVADRFSKYIV